MSPIASNTPVCVSKIILPYTAVLSAAALGGIYSIALNNRLNIKAFLTSAKRIIKYSLSFSACRAADCLSACRFANRLQNLSHLSYLTTVHPCTMAHTYHLPWWESLFGASIMWQSLRTESYTGHNTFLFYQAVPRDCRFPQSLRDP